MATKTLINGTAYEIKGGKTLVGGTAYKIERGKTLVGGTAYKIDLKGTYVVTLCKLDSTKPDIAYANATVNGQTYDSSENVSIVVQGGQSVQIKLVCAGSSLFAGHCYVYQNGKSVTLQSSKVNTILEYTYRVKSDCYILLSTSGSVSNRTSYAYIYDNNHIPFCHWGGNSTTLTTRCADDGMTWSEWLVSEHYSTEGTAIKHYEQDGYVIREVISNGAIAYMTYNGNKVKSSDKIIPFATYGFISS